MAKQFINEFKEGTPVNTKLSIKYKHPPRPYKNKPGRWFEIGLSDRTGEIELKYWGKAEKSKVQELYDSLKEEDVVEVRGKTAGTLTGNKLEIHVNEDTDFLQKTKDFDIADYVPATETSIEDMEKQLNSVIAEIKEPKLKALLDSFLEDKEFMQNFKSAPAAMYMHHAAIGGLLEHTLHVVDICKTLARIYPSMDRDLMLCGAILHDIGKIKEFKATTNIKETESGMLLGHIVLGVEMLLEKIKKIPDFPETLNLKLVHIMLSHHGNQEYGSPKLPSFSEAVAVYYADELDSKVDQFVKIKKEVLTEDFRTYSKKLKRGIYLK